MTYLSPHFTLEEAVFSETAIRQSIKNEPTAYILGIMTDTASKMEIVRTILGKPIRITSWLRVLRLNNAIGSVSTSGHIKGWAVDFQCPDFGTPLEIIKCLVNSGIKFDQMIQEGTWVHISFDPRLRGEVLTAVFTKGKPTTYKAGL